MLQVTDVSVEEEPASSSELQLDGLPKDVHQRVMRLTQINNKMMQVTTSVHPETCWSINDEG